MPNADGPAAVTVTTARDVTGPGLTRRQGLVALALLAPAGLIVACTGSAEPPSGSATASATPADVAAEVAAEETALIAAYDAVLTGVPGLGDETTALLALIRGQHAQHLEALGGAPDDTSAADAATAATPGEALTGLITAERQAARSRIRACVASDDADLARLLTFIGASEASHVPALRDLASAGA